MKSFSFQIKILLTATMIFLGFGCEKIDFVENEMALEEEFQEFNVHFSKILDLAKKSDDIMVLNKDDGIDYLIIKKDIDQNEEELLTPRKEYCRGNGVSFARCVRDAVDTYGCVKVTYDGGRDEYVGSSCD
jgi:hypothetical protein